MVPWMWRTNGRTNYFTDYKMKHMLMTVTRLIYDIWDVVYKRVTSTQAKNSSDALVVA